ncbi:hypothetical protein ABT300_27120 [Streptomyces sp. NPDC001027]|uniref:hypothetical protein n=1 Tax=Streptomyces sp. NPDC001027 TaxID=3154771 RepID=UPI0033319F4A
MYDLMDAGVGQEAGRLSLLSQSRPCMSVETVMRSLAGELDAVPSQSHDHRTDSPTSGRSYPHGNEPALLGCLDATAAQENLTHVSPESQRDATDPRGSGDGARRVKSAGETEYATAVMNFEHIGIGIGRTVLAAATAVASHVPPPLAEPLQKCNALAGP